MGEKGAKLTPESTAAAEALVAEFAVLGDITSRRMFGGHGIFCDRVMFALVDSAGQAFVRVDDELHAELEAEGSTSHGRMPYMSIPDGTDLGALGARAKAIASAAA